MITKMGYQSPWALFPMDNVPIYSNMSQMRNYNKEFRNIAMKTRDEFKDETKCLLPCKYMEYKVHFKILWAAHVMGSSCNGQFGVWAFIVILLLSSL